MAATDGARVIALLNQKGGVGKTTTTANLGAAIALAGRRVCMIDLDPQAHLTLHLGVDPGRDAPSVYSLLVDPDVPASAVVTTAREHLDLLPSEVDLAAAEVELTHHPRRQRILADKFAEIRDRYEFVLIDCPPSLGLLTLNALLLAREVIVPMQAHFLALQGVSKLLETVGLVCRSVKPDLQVTGVVLCMHEGQTTLAREIVADLEGFFEQSREQIVPWRRCQVLQPPIRRNIKLAEAPSFGQTIFDYSPWCPGALDYRMLAERLVADWDLRCGRGIQTATQGAEAGVREPSPGMATASSPPGSEAGPRPPWGAGPRPPSGGGPQPPSDDGHRAGDETETPERPASELEDKPLVIVNPLAIPMPNHADQSER